MANLTRAPDLIALFSRLLSRPLALAILVAAASAGGAQRASASRPRNDGPSVHAVPHLQSVGLNRAEDGPRVPRRSAPHADAPLAVGASPALHSPSDLVCATSVSVARATPRGARGYDATAPPLLC